MSGLGEYVLHWDGTAWTVARQWMRSNGNPLELTGVTAFNPGDVWVFGAPGAGPGLGTWHLHGTTWTHVSGIGGGITEASAVSATDMWAIGASSAPQDIIVHCNGWAWQQVTGPALSGLQFSGVLALSDTNIWLSAIKGSSPQLLHFNGSQWQTIAVPWRLWLGNVASDGHGGVWITGDQVSTSNGYALYYTQAGAWSRHRFGAGNSVISFALIPGTTSVWAAGGTPDPAGGGDATVWADGAAG